MNGVVPNPVSSSASCRLLSSTTMFTNLAQTIPTLDPPPTNLLPKIPHIVFNIIVLVIAVFSIIVLVVLHDHQLEHPLPEFPVFFYHALSFLTACHGVQEHQLIHALAGFSYTRGVVRFVTLPIFFSPPATVGGGVPYRLGSAEARRAGTGARAPRGRPRARACSRFTYRRR